VPSASVKAAPGRLWCLRRCLRERVSGLARALTLTTGYACAARPVQGSISHATAYACHAEAGAVNE